jgi:predicted RNA binding protein YcfA (HicA-like mRNA interferase family)
LSKLRLVDAKTVEKLLLSLGFAKVRQKGSHAFYKHPDGRTTTLPHHKGRMLARPLMREILREIELTVDEYNSYLEKV